MNLYPIPQTLEAIRPYAASIGLGALVASGLHQTLAVSRGLRRGTTYLRECGRASNIAMASLGGLAVGCASKPFFSNNVAHSTPENLLTYGGLAISGAAFGAIFNQVAQTLRSPRGLVDRIGRNAKNGAITGAISFPLAYGAAELITKIIERSL